MSANPSIEPTPNGVPPLPAAAARDYPMLLRGTLLGVLLLTIAAIALPWSAHCESRIALVVGNASYASGKLASRALDADRVEMAQEIRRFGDALGQPDVVALFYCSGHGLQLDGRCYIIPIGAEIDATTDIDSGIRVNSVLSRMSAGSPKIIILDACHNNPYEKSGNPPQQELAKMEAPRTPIALAAAPGSVAAGSHGELSPYTKALITPMKPGGDLVNTFLAAHAVASNWSGGNKKPAITPCVYASADDLLLKIPRPDQATTPEQDEQRIVLQEVGSRFPKLTGRVVDEAHIITDEDKQAMIRFTDEHERHTTNQIVVVTVNSLRGMPIGQFSLELGNYWHIGQRGKDNGVLLIVAPMERSVRIEVGRGLEHVLTNEKSRQIIDHALSPRFRSGQLSAGITDGVKAIVAALEQADYFDDFSSYPPGSPPVGWVLRGANQVTPTVSDVGGVGPSYRLVDFPEVRWQYWDKWLLKDGLTPHAPYTLTVKINFRHKVADGAGLTIAWNEGKSDRIDIQPNVYGNFIGFRESYSGSIQSTAAVNSIGHIPINEMTDYWLRVVVKDDMPGQGRLAVLWSTDGIRFRQVIDATGLHDLRGLVGVSTVGPHLPHVYFDDFSVVSGIAPDETSVERVKNTLTMAAAEALKLFKELPAASQVGLFILVIVVIPVLVVLLWFLRLLIKHEREKEQTLKQLMASWQERGQSVEETDTAVNAAEQIEGELRALTAHLEELKRDKERLVRDLEVATNERRQLLSMLEAKDRLQ